MSNVVDLNVADLTWDVVSKRIAAGAFAILPIGAGAKQHGFHLPMRTDQVQAEWLAAALSARFDALVWPTLTYGFYPAFVAYSGSASLSESTFERVVRELVAALVGYGARVLVVDTGISTRAAVDRALVGLDRAMHLCVYDGPRARDAARTLATQPHGGHADEIETSIMLALAPDTVAMARAEASPAMAPGPGPMQHADPAGANHSRAGSIGDPTLATREKGEAMLAAMIEDAVEAVSAWV